jgi:hypothetical protein
MVLAICICLVDVSSYISYLRGKILTVECEGGGSKGCKYQQGS